MHLPIYVKRETNVLLAGAGGGFDFLCALPLALTLMEQGCKVHIANYSFTDLSMVKNGKWLSEEILEVDSQADIISGSYFPELYLSRWFMERRGIRMPVYCFPKLGVKPLAKAYDLLWKRLGIDVVFVVDGGSDGIFRGDEYDLGTPSMDSISMIAANLSAIKEKHYVLTAFGSEGAEKKVSHAEVLNRISDAIRQDGFQGVCSLLKNTSVGIDFMNASRYIFSAMNQSSNIVSSIVCSMMGCFGDTAVNERTVERPIWVSPMTSMYWFFELDTMVKMKLFHKEAVHTETVMEMAELINGIHEKQGNRIRTSIPI